MIHNTIREKKAHTLRIIRKIHRVTAVFLFLVFIVLSITGIFLGWKKHSGGIIQAETHQGTSADFTKWLPVDSLYKNACTYLRDSVSSDVSVELDRVDIRKDKGMVKFLFKNGYWGVQIDGATGKLLTIERRRSDFIEQIHDASILDNLLGTTNGQIKLFYTTVAGLALLVFAITGFWLWYGPKRIRRIKR
jgi:uncharacterized iron-regulated membrane protein